MFYICQDLLYGFIPCFVKSSMGCWEEWVFHSCCMEYLKYTWSIVLPNSEVSFFFFFGLDDLCIDESWGLKSPHIIVSEPICVFMYNSACFMKLDALTFAAYLLDGLLSLLVWSDLLYLLWLLTNFDWKSALSDEYNSCLFLAFTCLVYSFRSSQFLSLCVFANELCFL
jgi:hypothetical protein